MNEEPRDLMMLVQRVTCQRGVQDECSPLAILLSR